LRTTPRANPQAYVTKERYVDTVLKVLDRHNQNPANSMRAYLILSVDRTNTPEEALHAVELAIAGQHRGIVGVDLCGNFAKGQVSTLAPAFRKAKEAGLGITLHFAEAELSGTDEELSTLLSWQPDRLGHVIHVKDEYRQEIVRRNIGVELCLSCNVQAKMIQGSFADHHFGWWKDQNVGVAISVSFQRHLQ
jgi:adenosine deaminase